VFDLTILRRFRWYILGAIGLSFLLVSMIQMPIETLEVQGVRHSELSEQVLERVLNYSDQGFFGAKLKPLQAEIESLKWVRRAAIKRQWPNQLTVKLFEHIPLAQWASGGIITRSGELIDSEEGDLPLYLSGPTDSEKRLATMYYQMQEQLAEVSLSIQGISLAERGSWCLDLTNGIRIELGREQILKRLGRFTRAWKASLGRDGQRILYVDMRYNSGLSVGWRK
tara:strand:- start:509 stop:1183 length:675 start_codon:yes stop_codon:yes gene_type:complete